VQLRSFKMAEDNIILVKKPKATSVVWSYFGLEANESGVPKVDQEQKPVCHKCKRSVPAKGGTKSSLMSHLKEHHSNLYVEALTAQKLQQSKEDSSKTSNQEGVISSEISSSTTKIKDVLLANRKYSPKSSQAVAY